MTFRVILHLEILGFEVFGSKIPFLKVLDYHNSLQRAITRHGELGHRTGGPARPQLATASKLTRLGEWTVQQRTVCSLQAPLSSFGPVFLRAVFLHY
jgi:hypothetical protein